MKLNHDKVCRPEVSFKTKSQVSWGRKSSLCPWKQLLPAVLFPKHKFCHGNWGCSHLLLVMQKWTLFSGNNIVVDSVVVHGIWARHLPPFFSSEAIRLLCWMNVGVSLGVLHCLSVVFKTFSVVLLLRTRHSIKVRLTAGKSCKTFSASSRRMQTALGFSS